MKFKYLLLFLLIFLNLTLLSYLYITLNSQTFSLSACNGQICPYVQELVKQLNTSKFDKKVRYQIYTANFEENDQVIVPTDFSSFRILWLGSHNHLSTNNLQYYNYILVSSLELQNFLKQQGITSYSIYDVDFS